MLLLLYFRQINGDEIDYAEDEYCARRVNVHNLTEKTASIMSVNLVMNVKRTTTRLALTYIDRHSHSTSSLYCSLSTHFLLLCFITILAFGDSFLVPRYR